MHASVLVVALAFGAPALKDKPKPDEGLIGLWELERTESGAAQPDRKRDAPLRYQFNKDGTYVIFEGEKEIVGPRKFAFDANAKPATLDTRVNQKDNGQTVYGIYKVEGDLLTICKTPPGKGRPTEFTTAPGSPNYIMYFRRVKTKD
ncbi:MAG TPA: TIGR03067 domain-containing protein [Gemmataceae bacterium]|nr:TIGR03067 domain-containing protein [Gemmataceae bacterium]